MLNQYGFSLSPFLNGHFPGEPGLAGFMGAKDDGDGGDNWSYKTCKAAIKSSPSNKPTPAFLQAGRPSCHDQQHQSTEVNISHSTDMLTPSSPGGLPTLSLTIKGS